MPTDTGILTALLNTFLNVFSGGFGGVLPDARRFLFLLSGIELTIVALWWALRGENFIITLIQKLLMIGIFAFFVLNWPAFVNSVVGGFVGIGLAAGGAGGGGGFPSMTNPSGIVDQGFALVQPILAKMATFGFMDLANIILFGVAALCAILCFFLLAIQVALTYLEFYIVAVLSLALVPFGINRYTAFLSEKAFGSIVGFGVKLMVLAFIMSAATPVLGALTMPADPDWRQAWSLVLGSAFLVFLAWQAPGIAAGMMSGGPSLTASTVARSAASGLIAAGGAAGMAAGAATTAVAGGAAATRAAAAGAGTVRAGGQLGAATAAMAGQGRFGQAVGAVQGAASAAAGATRNAAMAPVRDASESLKRSFRAGEVAGWRGLGLNPEPSPQANGGPKPAAGRQQRSAFDQMARAAGSVPPDAQPHGGGMAPNLRS